MRQRSHARKRDEAGCKPEGLQDRQPAARIKINTSPIDFAPLEQVRLRRFKGDKWELSDPCSAAKSEARLFRHSATSPQTTAVVGGLFAVGGRARCFKGCNGVPTSVNKPLGSLFTDSCFNQVTSNVAESKGISVEKLSVDIGGVPVEWRTAKMGRSLHAGSEGQELGARNAWLAA